MVPEELAARAKKIIKPLIEDFQSRTSYLEPSEIVSAVMGAAHRGRSQGDLQKRDGVDYEPKLAAYLVLLLTGEFLCSNRTAEHLPQSVRTALRPLIFIAACCCFTISWKQKPLELSG